MRLFCEFKRTHSRVSLFTYDVTSGRVTFLPEMPALVLGPAGDLSIGLRLAALAWHRRDNHLGMSGSPKAFLGGGVSSSARRPWVLRHGRAPPHVFRLAGVSYPAVVAVAGSLRGPRAPAGPSWHGGYARWKRAVRSLEGARNILDRRSTMVSATGDSGGGGSSNVPPPPTCAANPPPTMAGVCRGLRTKPTPPPLSSGTPQPPSVTLPYVSRARRTHKRHGRINKIHNKYIIDVITMCVPSSEWQTRARLAIIRILTPSAQSWPFALTCHSQVLSSHLSSGDPTALLVPS